MTSWTNIFTGGVIQPSEVSFQNYEIDDGAIILVWPDQFNEADQKVFARIMNISSLDPNGIVIFPDATLTSVGYSTLIYNPGSETIIIQDNSGFEIATIDAGIAKYFYLEDNSTSQGQWNIFTQGTGTSGADASLLAGYGLLSFNNKLNTNFLQTTISTDFNITNSDRGKLIVYNGGTGNATLPAPGSANVTNGFWVAINNQSPFSGVLTIENPYGFIDNFGNSTLNLTPGSSTILITDGVSDYYTLGLGIPTFFTVAVNEKNVSGDEDISLDTEEAVRQIQNFFGTLTGNITITFPNTPYIWYVSNETTGAFELNITIDGGNTLELLQGEQYIIVGDSTSLKAYPSTAQNILNLPFILKTPVEGTPNAQVLSTLNTGMLKNTTLTGELSIGINGTDYYAPGTPNLFILTNQTPPAANGAGVYIYSTANNNISFKSGLSTYSVYVDDTNLNTGIANGTYEFSTGYENTVIGIRSGRYIDEGYQNTLVGTDAGNILTTNVKNSIFGASSGADATFNECIILGANNVINDNGQNITIIGNDITASSDNILILGTSQKIGINTNNPTGGFHLSNANGLDTTLVIESTDGIPTSPTSGVKIRYTDNTEILKFPNFASIKYMDEFGNIIYGDVPSIDTSSSQNNILLGSPDYSSIENNTIGNVSYGTNALANINKAQYNTAIGFSALENITSEQNNTAVGAGAASQRSDYENCVFLGAGADATSKVNSSIAIGYDAKVSSDNTCVIGGSSLESVLIGSSTLPTLNKLGAYQKETLNLRTANGGSAGIYMDASLFRNEPDEGGIIYVSSINDKLLFTAKNRPSKVVSTNPVSYYGVQIPTVATTIPIGGVFRAPVTVSAALEDILKNNYDDNVIYNNTAVLVMESGFNIFTNGGITNVDLDVKFYRRVGAATYESYDGIPATTNVISSFGGSPTLNMINIRVTVNIFDAYDPAAEEWGFEFTNNSLNDVSIEGNTTPGNAYIIPDGIL